jgi:Fe2+ transport system protein FeoA
MDATAATESPHTLTLPGPVMALTHLLPGRPAIIHQIDLPPEQALPLKRMGVCPGRRVRLIRPGNPAMIQVCETRLGLAACLAERILVEQCLPEGDEEAACPRS